MGLHDSDLTRSSVLPDHLSHRRTTFKHRVKYHSELIHSGSCEVSWLPATKLAVTDCLWDVQRLCLSYLQDVSQGDRIENGARVQEAVQYVVEEFNDPDLQQALKEIQWQGNRSHIKTVEDEVTNYLSLQLLSIQFSITILTAPTLLEGLRSPKAQSIAMKQLSRGRACSLRREGPAHEFYTWAFVIDLGLIAMAFSPEETPEGTICMWISLIRRMCMGYRTTPETGKTKIRKSDCGVLG
jgi:hypothetical protein